MALGLAVAAPSSMADPERTLEDVRQQVDALNDEVVQATERFNAAHDERTEVERRLERARSTVAKQQAQVEESMQQVGQFASATYRNSGVDMTLQTLVTGDPEVVMERASSLDAYARQQESHLATLTSQRRQLTDAELVVEEDVARLEAIAQEREDTRTEIEASLAKAEELLAGLEAEERARLEAERIAAEQQAAEEAERARREAQDRASRDGERDATVTSDDDDTSDNNTDNNTDNDSDNDSDHDSDHGSDEDSDTDSGSDDDPPATSDRAQVAVDFALAQLGDSYRYGANGPNSWDCSGLTTAAWKEAGVSLPRSSGAQASAGTPVSKSQLQPGDLVFYYSPISHVGIYIGNGKLVHASRPGVPVNVTSVDSMPYSGAVRPG